MEHNDRSRLTAGNSQKCAALLTPPGAAAIAVVRIAGPGVREFLAAHFTGKAVIGRPAYGSLVDRSETIDDVVVVLREADAFADISLHGGPWIVRAMMELARRSGFAAAEKGDEGLAPALALDTDSEIEREILSNLPLATTELGLRSLLSQARAWRELQQRGASVDGLGAILEDRSLHWLLHPPHVAIVGAANVGKSTLANQLFAQERSITSDVPGTTRDWVGESANLDGLPILLVDTPGIRQTNDPIEARAIEASADQVRAADLALLVLDASRPMGPQQSPLLVRFPDALFVINKADLPRRLKFDGLEGIETVATSGKGIDVLIRRILDRFGNPQRDADRPRWWTQRQRELLTRGKLDAL